MNIVESLTRLSKEEQKNYILGQLLMINNEERKKFIESIVLIYQWGLK